MPVKASWVQGEANTRAVGSLGGGEPARASRADGQGRGRWPAMVYVVHFLRWGKIGIQAKLLKVDAECVGKAWLGPIGILMEVGIRIGTLGDE